MLEMLMNLWSSDLMLPWTVSQSEVTNKISLVKAVEWSLYTSYYEINDNVFYREV